MLKLLSHLLSPPVIAIAAVTIFSSSSPNFFLSAALGILLLAVIPTLPLFYLLKKGQVDMDMTSRKIRAATMLTSIAGDIASSAVFYYLDYRAMLAISLAYLFVSVAVAINNLFWKISIHAAGIAGPTTALVYVFGVSLIPLYILTATVFYVRMKLKAHTPAQLFGGVVIGIAITFLTYLIFY